ncbi:MAG: hypothetical protein ABSC90_05770 [Acidimicrobiales bacterium]|jgi:hypothetical protein
MPRLKEGTLPVGGSASGAGSVTLPVRWGLTADYRYPSFDSVEVTLRFRGRRLWCHRFAPESSERRHSLALGLIRVELVVGCDMFSGTLTTGAGIDRRPRLGRPWVRSRRWRGKPIIRFDPSVGEIGGRTDVHPPLVHDPQFGDSQSCTGTIFRIHVDDERRDLCEVGSKVKARMFPPPYPPFVFNAVACVGAFEEDGPQRYGDPLSPWFNVFLGYYQLDCDKARWDRPFGFETADGAASRPCMEDLIRLGKSDWNYFSNWNYGVPEQALEPYCDVDVQPGDYVDNGLVVIAGRRWRHVDLLGVDVASSYVSGAPRAAQLVLNTIITGMVRQGFGYPCPRPDHPVSFVPTKLDATLHMAYVDDEQWFHTLIFGGTTHAGEDRGLLTAEIDATKAIVAQHYAGSGFE